MPFQRPRRLTHPDISHGHHPAALVQVLLQVAIDVLEDERQGSPGVDDVVQGDNVHVLEVLEQGYLPNGGAGSPLLVF